MPHELPDGTWTYDDDDIIEERERADEYGQERLDVYYSDWSTFVVFATSDGAQFRYWAASDADLAEDMYATGRGQWADELLRRLLQDPDPTVRGEAARHPRLPAHLRAMVALGEDG